MTDEQKVGLLLWAVIFWPMWSPMCNYLRWKRRREGARASTPARPTARPPVPVASRSRQTGPMWEQDKPFPECFEEDDLDG